MRNFHLSVIIVFLSLSSLTAQQQVLPLNHRMSQEVEEGVSAVDNNFHSSVKPYLYSWAYDNVNDTLMSLISANRERKLLYRKLKTEHLFIVDTGKFYLTVDILCNFEWGTDLADTSLAADTSTLYVNTRGFIIKGDIGEKVSFKTSFYENQAFFPTYLSEYISQNKVVPGAGRIKTFKQTGFDYAMSTGLVSITPVKSLNFQFGHGKNFIGDGYRSLLLSDNSFNYPFFKITTHFGRFQYTNIFANFQNLNVELPTSPTTEERFQRKLGTINHLNFIVNKRIHLGIFESIIWKASDSNGKWMYEDDYLNFINPVIMVRPFQFGLNDKNNVLVGMNLKIKLADKMNLYAQAMLDDNKSQKYGFQVGFKGFDLFKIKNLYFQAEYNTVSAYSYGHNDSTRNYAHYNQALAHPLGAGFSEFIGIVNYRVKGFFIDVKFNYATYPEDSLRQFHLGKDIFKSDASRLESDRSNTELLYETIKIGYIINPQTNLQLLIGFRNRSEKSNYWNKETQYFFIGLRTSLINQYFDF